LTSTRVLPTPRAASRSPIGLDRLRTQGVEPAAVHRALVQLGLGRRPLDASAGAGGLYNTLFGRDSIRMATDLVELYPPAAAATIHRLAELQGRRKNWRSEEEPGRIIHEFRSKDDPIAKQLKEWTFPYYGSVDATPNWINLVAGYTRAHGDHVLDERVGGRFGSTPTIREAVGAAAQWILSRMDDPRGGGYLWVQRSNPHGLAVQVWEDSTDSFYFADGSLVDPSRPFAPAHLQGYAYDALLNAAEIFARSPGKPPLDPARLRARAAELRAQFLAQFWRPELGTFAQAISYSRPGAGRSADVVSSGAGHLLASRMLDGADARPFVEATVKTLLSPAQQSAAGIKTKPTGSARYRPGSYHNGSSWPFDHAIFIEGLRRHGYEGEATAQEDKLLRAVARDGFVEFFRGDPHHVAVNRKVVDIIDRDGRPNRLQQPPQGLHDGAQGWTVTAVAKILARRGVEVLPRAE